MKTTEYLAFILNHRIFLPDYLKEYYSLKFQKINNHWESLSKPKIIIDENNFWEREIPLKNPFSHPYKINKNHGTIVTWEMIKNNCSQMQAVGIIMSRKEPLTFKTPYYIELEKLFQKVARRLKDFILYDKDVQKFLKSNGVDINYAQNNFLLGFPTDYDTLFSSFKRKYTDDIKLQKMLEDLYITPNANASYLPFGTVFSLPVWNTQKDFLGFHGRDINKTNYFNSGFLKENIKNTLFDESSDDILKEIKDTKQVVITENIIDFLRCQQNGIKFSFSVFDKNIYSPQFNYLKSLKVNTIIAGFSEDKTQKRLFGLALLYFKKNPIQFLNQVPPTLKNNTINANQLIKKAFKEKEALFLAAIAHANHIMEKAKEIGAVYRIDKNKLMKELEDAKGSHKKLKTFLEKKSKTKNDHLTTPYVTIVSHFKGDDLKAELRTLLFLLLKKTTNPVRYNLKTLANELSLNKRQLHNHLKLLKEKRYLLTEKKNNGHGVVHIFYPSTIKYSIKGELS